MVRREEYYTQESSEGSEMNSTVNKMESRISEIEETLKRAVGNKMSKVTVKRNRGKKSSVPFTPSVSLIQMAERGDHEGLLRVLSTLEIDLQGHPECTANGNTALHAAANGGHVQAVVILLGAGAKVNATGYLRRTPLHCAVIQGHLAVVQRLLVSGAKIDVKDAEGSTPLELVAERGNSDLAISLLQAGANPNKKAVIMAAENGHWNIVASFLQNGNLTFKQAVSMASENGTSHLVELFLQNIRGLVNVCNREGDPLIVLAAKANRWQIVHLLLEKGATATKCKTDRECALMWASQAGQEDAVGDLLRRGAASNTKQVKMAFSNATSAAEVSLFEELVPRKVLEKSGRPGYTYNMADQDTHITWYTDQDNVEPKTGIFHTENIDFTGDFVEPLY